MKTSIQPPRSASESYELARQRSLQTLALDERGIVSRMEADRKAFATFVEVQHEYYETRRFSPPSGSTADDERALLVMHRYVNEALRLFISLETDKDLANGRPGSHPAPA